MKKTISLTFLILLLITLLLVFVACGEEEACEHQWNEGYEAEAPTDTKVGYKIYTCNLCGETRSEEIPKLTHAKHTFNKTQWAWNKQNHWMVCDFEGCEATTTKDGVHLYSDSSKNENGLICLICRSTSKDHTFTTNMQFDENSHWIACDEKDCTAKYTKASHTIMDNKCLSCDYTITKES